MKKLLSLVPLFLFALTGCGSGNSDTGDSGIVQMPVSKEQASGSSLPPAARANIPTPGK